MRSFAAFLRGDVAFVQAQVGSLSGDEEAVQMVEEEAAIIADMGRKARP